MIAPARPVPTRVMVFVDAQNLYHRCRDHFGHPWIHPRSLADALIGEDRAKQGDTHVLAGVRYYTGIHDANRNARGHSLMEHRLSAYVAAGRRFGSSSGQMPPSTVRTLVHLQLPSPLFANDPGPAGRVGLRAV